MFYSLMNDRVIRKRYGASVKPYNEAANAEMLLVLNTASE